MKSTINFLVLVFGLLLLANVVYAESPREQLKQMVEQLQQSPNDNALREKIIKLAPKLKPSPALPDAAVTFEGRAQFAFRSAKSEGDFLAAAQEYEKAVAAAPWVLGYYTDLCTIYEKAGKFEDAKRHCGFYLLGLTDPAEITNVKRRIAGLEFGIEKKQTAADESAKKAKTLIVPGVGIGEVKIGMRESQVTAALGAPSRRDKLVNPVDGIAAFLDYGSLTVSLTSDGKVMQVSTLYQGFVTSEGVGVGSSKAEISAAMGTPSKKFEQGAGGGWVWFYERGVSFHFPVESTVHWVTVQEPR